MAGWEPCITSGPWTATCGSRVSVIAEPGTTANSGAGRLSEVQRLGGPAGGVAAAVVLAEEAPDGRERVEHPVAVLDAMRVEDVRDAGFGQDVGEREPSLRAKRA